MSEKLHESLEHLEHRENQVEKEPARPEVSVEHEQHKQHETLRHAEKAVEEQAKSKDEIQVESGTHHSEQPSYVNRELKSIALERTLARVRRHLSAPDKALSKLIHKPAVQAVSDAGAKTVARPSGLLAGSMTALIGSTLVLYLAKHYGFRYNYLLFFVLFGGGFALGLAIEFGVWLIRRRRVTL